MRAPDAGWRGLDSQRTGWRRVVPLAVGVLLFGAAIGVVVQRRGAIVEGFEHAAGSPWWALALVVLFPVLSLVTTSASLWILTRRFQHADHPVGFGEMLALVSGATLLNYLPLRPGLLGRVAYHKRVHKIPIKDSVRVLIEGTVLSVLAAVTLLAIDVLGGLGRHTVVDTVVLAAPVLVLAILWLPMRRARTGAWLAAGAIRYLDMLVWTGRYALLLWVLGTPVGLEVAVVIASLSQIAMLAPTGGGGVGVREWTVGVVGGGLGATLETALVADLINRAAELVVAVPAGLLGLALVRGWLRGWSKRRAAKRAARQSRTLGKKQSAGPENADSTSAASSAEPEANDPLRSP